MCIRDRAVRAKKAKNSKEKLQRAGKTIEDEASAAARAAEERKLAKDRELNKQKNEVAAAAAVQAQIAQLISMNGVTERGDIEFSYPEENLIKTISVTERQRGALVAGTLTIVKHRDRYHLVPRKTAEKIAERDNMAVLLCNDETGDQQYEDDYADFQVPDDLMW